ncbi:MAG: response regulator transcription factor [Bacteroidota bacterium]|nr:response regulator transcription factor [Bacteroidota bacterium]
MDIINIILADDHEIFRKGLEVTLRRVNFVGRILHATNGNEVISIMNSGEPVQVIIMDIRMPELDGISATIQLRMKYQDVKILALSMMDDKASIVQMFKAGANGYLLKNTNKLELAEAMQHVLEGNTYYSKEVSELLLRHNLEKLPLPRKTQFITELTSREQEVLKLICHQYSTKEIAEMLCLSERTIEGHRKNLMEKTQSKNMAGLVYYALENGIVRIGK